MAVRPISRSKEEKELLKLEEYERKQREKKMAKDAADAEEAAKALKEEYADRDTGASYADIHGIDTSDIQKGPGSEELLREGEEGVETKKKKEIDYDDPKLSFLQYLNSPDTPHQRAEKREKRRKRILAALAVFFALTTIIFISLYFYAQSRFSVACRTQFNESLTRVLVLMDAALADETDFDYETKAKEMTGELGVARQMVIFLGEPEGTQKCLSDLYYASIRMPNQVKTYLAEIREGVGFVLDGETDKGYAALNKVIEKFDRYDITPDDGQSEES